MKLKKITLENIRSYKNAEIDFPDGSTLLSGDIGSGKTSILLGIEFALFGLQPGQRGNAILRNGEDFGKVKIEFEVDEKEVVIERTLKRGKTISQDACSISIDDNKKELSVTELKNKVLEILDYPKEFSKKQNILYKFTVYTPQEEMKQIILQDAQTRMDTLRHVFGIDRYKRILENLSIVASKIREEKRIKEGITLNLEQDRLNLIEKEKELLSRRENLSFLDGELLIKSEEKNKVQKEKDEIQKKIDEKNKFQQEIEKTKITISHKKDSIASNNRSVLEIKNQIQEISSLSFDEFKIFEIEKEISQNKSEKEKSTEKIMEINSKINSLVLKNEDAKKLERQISNLESCPTCLQTVEAVYRANVLNKCHNDISKNQIEMDSLENQKLEYLNKIKLTESKIINFEKELNDLKIIKLKMERVEEKQKQLREIENLNFTFEKDVDLLTRHIETLNNSVFELSRFNIAFETIKRQLDEALRQERMAEIKVAETKKEIEVFSSQIEEFKIRITQTEKVKQELDYLSKLENWLSKEFAVVISHIEKNVMVKLESEFSKLFAEWFAMLVSDSFHVRLSDDFTPIIEQQDYEIDYSYLSGGERTAIALAYRLSLNQVINSLMSKIKTKDIVILDEPTDGFSEQQLDKMREVLDELKVKQLIIVSHEQKIEGFVENVIRFKKENGVSVRE